MKSYRNLALSAALASFVATAALPSYAQNSGTAPIVVRQSPVKPGKSVWLKAEVVHADRNSIIVREQEDPLVIHTFTYSDQLKPKMEKFADQGQFQVGDKVKILFQP